MGLPCHQMVAKQQWRGQTAAQMKVANKYLSELGFLYFLNLYLCRRYFPSRAQIVDLGADDEARRRMTHTWKLARSWEWDDNIWQYFNMIYLTLSIVFLPFDQAYFFELVKCISLQPDCGADESYRLEGRIGTVLHSCLGHLLQQQNMMERNKNSN